MTAALAAVTASPVDAAVTFVDIIPNYNVGGIYPRFYDVDFNGDGTPEIRMDVSLLATTGFRALPASHSKVVSVPDDPGSYFAWPIYNGEVVGPVAPDSSQWIYDTNGSGLAACVSFGSSVVCLGYFWNFTIANVGVEFTLPDGVHYGVIEVQGIYGGGNIRSYAWETDPGVPIVAGAMPEPSRAVLIFGGMLAVLSHRRRRRALGSG
ncbi:MAG: PEP-CTERM sorting domain-containing protein [Verrucomicrobiaceae bacterium]|nr:PEP-CTERM sorting domain-containing protein [Verrucomicrobiaceae bacterium]